MSLTSVSFLLFAAVLLLAYYCVPKRAQWVVLLAGSWIFYLTADWRYFLFLGVTVLTSYAATRIMGSRLERQECYLKENKATMSREEKKAYKARIKSFNRICLSACLVINFGMLFVCKAALLKPVQSGALGFLSLGLPMGISFYLFQTMGYCIDVYRGTVKAEKCVFRMALFTSFFPQLIQGPISKFSQLAPQLYGQHRFESKTVAFGLQRMLWGYFKKLVIADRIAVAVGMLKSPAFGGSGFFLLTFLYAIQLYADFTGGMDMVIGLSEAMGIRLTENFRRPFFSKNIAEYWRRWHISLGEWMKDYIFYPISVSQPMLKLSKAGRKHLGNFGKRLPVYIASVATWFVTGIWHGLSANFILWGMLNCFFIVLSEECQPLYAKFHGRFHLKDKSWYGAFEMLRMFVLMNLIRACDLFPKVGDYFSALASMVTKPNFGIFTDGTLTKLGLTGLDWGILGFGIVLMLSVSVYQEVKGGVREGLQKLPWVCRYAMIFMLFVAVLLMGSYGLGYDAGSFIYNQF